MKNEKACSLNYEAEYYKLVEERERLLAQMDYMRSEHNALEAEFARMRAQLDIVYLIFGGK
jgi:cell division protein FtsB